MSKRSGSASSQREQAGSGRLNAASAEGVIWKETLARKHAMKTRIVQLGLCTADLPQAVRRYCEGFGFQEAGAWLGASARRGSSRLETT